MSAISDIEAANLAAKNDLITSDITNSSLLSNANSFNDSTPAYNLSTGQLYIVMGDNNLIKKVNYNNAKMFNLIGNVNTNIVNINTNIGNLTSLTTTNKSSIVAAINELKAAINAL